ncbi:membrane protein [Thermococcus sp. EP1]|uniref:hypothetical protein n=1 Tax=Thermococcus sp. EP1 TaxID=1591054 RepID=UPI0006D9B261|nr:hypothetical protein [Thermococcus sp. EP1]KPU62822.1 membrane protein [Thermococcus sp. EP1]
MLYEERRFSKLMLFLAVPGFVGLFGGLWGTYTAGEGFEIMVVISTIVILILIDLLMFKIEIDEREIRLRGTLGIIIRKTIKIEDIESFEVKEGWIGCWAPIRFNFPAEGCITIHKRGLDVAFTTRNPEEIAMILTTLGVPREA